MNKILISIKPEWVAKILNGEKTIEVRKTAPNCWLPIEVYIYCTKGKTRTNVHQDKNWNGKVDKEGINVRQDTNWNGKIVAKFTLKSVEKIKYHFGYYDMGEWTESYILEKSRLSDDELDDYLQASKDYDESKPSPVYGYAWHIEDLEIFDELKELDEFGLKNAPQSWCYVEAKE